MNNTEAATAFLDWLQIKRGASRHTLNKYRTVIAAFDRWGEGRPFAAMTDLDIESFTMGRPRRGGVQAAPATVTLETAALRSLYRWGQARLGWDSNPAALATHPKVRNRMPRPVPDDVWLSVWTAELPLDARVALGLGFFCGLRRQEIVSLRADQVWGRALVNFTRKGGGEDRFDYGDAIDHWTATMPELQAFRLEPPLRWLARTRGERLLMPWGDDYISDTGLNKRLYRWLAELGLPEDLFGPHQLRHSFATNLLRSGVPLHMASDLCNHSDINTTMRYIRTAGGRLRTLRDSGVGVAQITAGETR